LFLLVISDAVALCEDGSIAYRLTSTAETVLRIDEVRGNNPARRNEKEKLLTTNVTLSRISIGVACS
jgi:hypothetical protein